MLLKLIESIALKLKEKFNDYEFINNQMEQNFGKVMHIQALPHNVKRIVGNRFSNEIRIAITIFNDNMDELLGMSRDVFNSLEFLDFGEEILKGTNYSYTFKEGQGIAYITYIIWEYIPDKEIAMKTYELKEQINGKEKDRR